MSTKHTHHRNDVAAQLAELTTAAIAAGCDVSAADQASSLIAARLNCAAPELLLACRQAIVALKGREHDGFLRDAIEKATGVRP